MLDFPELFFVFWRCETFIERNLNIEDGNYAIQSFKNYIQINCEVLLAYHCCVFCFNQP